MKRETKIDLKKALEKKDCKAVETAEQITRTLCFMAD